MENRLGAARDMVLQGNAKDVMERTFAKRICLKKNKSRRGVNETERVEFRGMLCVK